MRVAYGTQTIEFRLERSKRAKNCYISVQRDSGIVVKAPEYMNEEEIALLVKSKAKWIVQKKSELGKVIDYGEITTGSRLFYLGKSYYVELLAESREDICVEFIHSKFKIHVPSSVKQQELNAAVQTFYRQRAKQKIDKLIKKYSQKMNLTPEYIGYKESNTKWGSCSPRNRITFNPEIMKLSSSLIEYAVIHELAHIAYKNHSKEFWRLVAKFMDDYKEKEEKLREFEKKL